MDYGWISGCREWGVCGYILALKCELGLTFASWNPLAVGSTCKIGKFCGTAAIPSRAVPCIIGMGRQKLPVRPFRRFRSAKVNSCCLE